jgi:hypothetical protein
MFFTHYKRLAPTVEEMAAKDFKDMDSEVTIIKWHSGNRLIEMLRRFLMRSLLQPSLCLRLDSLFWKVHPSAVSLA